MKTRQCDQCKFYKFQVENACGLNHKPRFYRPQTIYDLNCGHKKKCADFVAIECANGFGND